MKVRLVTVIIPSSARREDLKPSSPGSPDVNTFHSLVFIMRPRLNSSLRCWVNSAALPTLGEQGPALSMLTTPKEEPSCVYTAIRSSPNVGQENYKQQLYLSQTSPECSSQRNSQNKQFPEWFSLPRTSALGRINWRFLLCPGHKTLFRCLFIDNELFAKR